MAESFETLAGKVDLLISQYNSTQSALVALTASVARYGDQVIWQQRENDQSWKSFKESLARLEKSITDERAERIASMDKEAREREKQDDMEIAARQKDVGQTRGNLTKFAYAVVTTLLGLIAGLLLYILQK